MKRSQEELDTRQMPCRKEVVSEKNYCDLLYAWIQCNSERVNYHSKDRRISKQKVKFVNIERSMVDSNGDKIMDRRTISKYFKWLVAEGFLVEDGDYYNLRLLGNEEANIIQFKTLSILLNVLQRHAVDIYQYLYSRFCAVGKTGFKATFSQIKDFIGLAVNTSSNNGKIRDILTVLKGLRLLDYEFVTTEDEYGIKSYIEIKWVVNSLPDS